MAPKAFLIYATLLLFLAIFPYTILSRQSPEPKPFDFLQHLEGCHKGQTIKGVNQLKQYLRRFGYLASANLDGNDEFDELLESAVKTYQLNYNLKSTGTLDSQTIKQMKMPRCGFPDIQENGRTSMTSGKSNKKHHHDQNLLHTVSHYSFFPNSPRWPPSKTQLTYAFTSSSIPVVDIETLRSVCSKAFSKWAAVSGLSFLEVADQADIMIGFYRGDHVDDNNFDGPGRIAAHAFAPPDGRFHYDADEKWSTNPRSEMSEIDLESVTVHEIGHLLGLGHSSVETAVMSSTISPGVIKRDLLPMTLPVLDQCRSAIHHSIKDLHHFISRQRNMCNLHLFRYDTIDLTRQALAKKANQIFLKVREAYQSHNIKGVTFYSQHFMGLVNDMDTL